MFTLSRRLAAEALGTGLLVATVVGAPLYPRAVNCMIKIATGRVGVNSAVSAHWLRLPMRASSK